MRKRNKKKGLKVTINGQEETVYGEESKEKAEAEANYQVTFSNWEEKRKAEMETSAAKDEKKEDEFEWVLPEEEEANDDPKVVSPYQKKKASGKSPHNKKNKLFNSSIKRVTTTVIFAVLIGSGLGIFALSLSTDGGSPSTSASTEPSNNDSKGDETTETDKAGSAAESSGDGNLSTFAVQAGLYSSEEGANSVVDKLISEGYAAATLAKDEGYFVIAGIAEDKELTAALSQTLVDNGTEAWGGKELSFSIDAAISDSFKKACELSATAITGAQVPENEISALEEAVTSISGEESAGLKEGILKSLEYLKQPSAESGWKSQQALLDQLKNLSS
ncbi:SPOR domain-containing protein [Bacillus gobiensis]|uniref:SPOR domain-containing protein n=1 Tax=Bacillus gobiensis TaxID=1441095 RepID=UPI003D253B33